ncbi:CLUMA_CG012946, isoform A [Clunio marinus]|uniref:CLUMA_CG012946, isoform A n=1 Tax=Clunio marinus TaxID=568069 RepID=A0A1J1IHD9_9DIPT|nr:CLUMA_CG012946, isoform A [Clunio marinus]
MFENTEGWCTSMAIYVLPKTYLHTPSHCNFLKIENPLNICCYMLHMKQVFPLDKVEKLYESLMISWKITQKKLDEREMIHVDII